MMRRARIRPLQTDQFTLDPTCGSIEYTRLHIPEPANPGNSLRGFPVLVVPKGPITNVSLIIQAIANGKASLRIHKLVVSFVSREEGQRRAISCPPDEPITLSKLAAEPIGVYLMLAGKAEIIRFSVKTPTEERDTKWQRTLPG